MSWFFILIFVVIFIVSFWFYHRVDQSEEFGEESYEYEQIGAEDGDTTDNVDYSPTYVTVDYLVGKEVSVKWLDNKTYLTNRTEMILTDILPNGDIKGKSTIHNEKYLIKNDDLTHDGIKIIGNDIELVQDVLDIIPEYEEKLTSNMLNIFLNEEVCFNYRNFRGEERFHTIFVSRVDNETGVISGHFLNRGKREDTEYDFMVDSIPYGIFMIYVQTLYEFVSDDEIHLHD